MSTGSLLNLNMKDFRDLAVWRRAHQLTLDVYTIVASFPPGERFGLSNQLRRSISSVPTNLAEGCGRGSDADVARFVKIAMGSASEAEYQLLLAHDLRYLSEAEYRPISRSVVEVKNMLAGLLKSLRADR